MANASTLSTITTLSILLPTIYPYDSNDDLVPSVSAAAASSLHVPRTHKPSLDQSTHQPRQRVRPASDTDYDIDYCRRLGSHYISNSGSSYCGSSCLVNNAHLRPRSNTFPQPVSTVFAADPNTIDATAGTSAVFTSGRLVTDDLPRRQITSSTAGADTSSSGSYFSSMYSMGTTYTTVTVTAAAPAGASSSSSSSSHHGLSGGAIAAIVIGVLFGLLILPCLCLCLLLQHRRNKKKQKAQGARGLNMGMHDGTTDTTDRNSDVRLRRMSGVSRSGTRSPRHASAVLWPETGAPEIVSKEVGGTGENGELFPGWRTLTRAEVHESDLVPLGQATDIDGEREG